MRIMRDDIKNAIKELSRETRAHFYKQEPYASIKRTNSRATRLTRDLAADPALLAQALDIEVEMRRQKAEADAMLKERLEKLDRIKTGEIEDVQQKQIVPPMRFVSNEKEGADDEDMHPNDVNDKGVYRPSI